MRYDPQHDPDFDWDTGRRAREPGPAPVDLLKVLLWTLGILIGVPAILVVIGVFICFTGGIGGVAIVLGIAWWLFQRQRKGRQPQPRRRGHPGG